MSETSSGTEAFATVHHEVNNKRFLHLFSERSNSKVRVSPAGSWNSVSQYFDLTDSLLLDSIALTTKSERALQIAQNSKLLTLSIQRKNALNTIQSLRLALKRLEIEAFELYEVDEDSDFQVYILFSAYADINSIGKKLALYLNSLQLFSVEVAYANQHIVVPLQRNFSWIDAQLRPTQSRKRMTFSAALNRFLEELDNNIVCPEFLHTQLDQLLEQTSAYATESDCSREDNSESELIEQDKQIIEHQDDISGLVSTLSKLPKQLDLFSLVKVPVKTDPVEDSLTELPSQKTSGNLALSAEFHKLQAVRPPP